MPRSRSLRKRGPVAVVPLAAVVLTLPSGCTAGPVDPDRELPLTIRSTHFVFHHASGDAVDTVWQERYHVWLLSALDVPDVGRLDYYKYRDRPHMKAVTGKFTNGFAEPERARLHTIWPVDNHEEVHVLVGMYLGNPPGLFSEGIAVAHQTDPLRGVLHPRWNGRDLHELARERDVAGRLPALASLVTSSDFFRLDPELSYPTAGSFLRYLLDTHGLGPLKALVRRVDYRDDSGRIESGFRAAYGRTLSEEWASWRSWLAGIASGR